MCATTRRLRHDCGETVEPVDIFQVWKIWHLVVSLFLFLERMKTHSPTKL